MTRAATAAAVATTAVATRALGRLAQLQRADLFIQAKRAGTIEGGHAQCAMSVQGGGGTGNGGGVW